MNNTTTAKRELQHVAENSKVLQDQIEGIIVRDGQGPFVSVDQNILEKSEKE